MRQIIAWDPPPKNHYLVSSEQPSNNIFAKSETQFKKGAFLEAVLPHSKYQVVYVLIID